MTATTIETTRPLSLMQMRAVRDGLERELLEWEEDGERLDHMARHPHDAKAVKAWLSRESYGSGHYSIRLQYVEACKDVAAAEALYLAAARNQRRDLMLARDWQRWPLGGAQ